MEIISELGKRFVHESQLSCYFTLSCAVVATDVEHTTKTGHLPVSNVARLGKTTETSGLPCAAYPVI